jgi:hypothetical protein
MKQTGFLSNILTTRKNVIEFIAGAILVGFGVEFIAGSIYGHFNFLHKNLIFLAIGTLLVVVGLIFFILKLIGDKRLIKEIDGFLVIEKSNKSIIHIDSYDFADEMSRNIESAFHEDTGLKKIWNKTEFQIGKRTDNYKGVLKIINEAAEYYLLEKLSTHLSEYFNSEGHDKNQIVEYERQDIPDILLKNRFLELFSKPMEHRAAFLPDNEEVKEDDDSGGVIVASFSNGAMFSHFDLTLPKDSKIKRNADNSISIITKRFTLNIASITSGVNTYIPWEFCEYYLKLKNPQDLSELIVTFRVEIIFHFGAFFRTIGWQYYHWIDSFINELVENFEQEYYFNTKIEWDKAYTIIKSVQNLTDKPAASRVSKGDFTPCSSQNRT